MKIERPFSTDEKTAVKMVDRALKARGRPVGVSPVGDSKPQHEFVAKNPDESREAVHNAFLHGGNVSGVWWIIR